jgi:hypothetical protein
MTGVPSPRSTSERSGSGETLPLLGFWGTGDSEHPSSRVSEAHSHADERMGVLLRGLETCEASPNRDRTSRRFGAW